MTLISVSVCVWMLSHINSIVRLRNENNGGCFPPMLVFIQELKWK